MSADTIDLSLVIPLLNEEESLPELAAWIEKVMLENNFSYEIIFVDDGSTDNSWTVIEQLRTKNSNIKGIKFQRNYGKSAALNEGFRAAQGDVVITMDADLQDSPDEIPGLYAMIMNEKYFFGMSPFLDHSLFYGTNQRSYLPPRLHQYHSH